MPKWQLKSRASNAKKPSREKQDILTGCAHMLILGGDNPKNP
jgi:hypothetical protein